MDTYLRCEDLFPTMSSMKELMSASFINEEYLLDVPLCAEKIEAVLRRMKSGKSAGHDSLQAKHLKYGGPALNGFSKSAMQFRLEICSKLFYSWHYCSGI